MRQSLERFQYFNIETIFWNTKTLFEKLEYRFLIESTKIENATHLYKTALSEANVKTNKMGSTKWTYHKERSFASNHFFFIIAILFQYNNLT